MNQNQTESKPPTPEQPTDEGLDGTPCSALLDAALDLLAGWCDAVKNGGTGWDDWDEWYKDACYRPGPLRELLDARIKKLEACPMCEGRGEIGGITASDPGGCSEPCPECNSLPNNR